MPKATSITFRGIRVCDITKSVEGEVQRVTANVHGEEVWFESSDAELEAGAEAFLSAFLMVAFELERTLICETPVCPVWFENIERFGHIYGEHWKRKCVSPAVPKHPEIERESMESNAGAGLFFTCGVHSFHGLLKQSFMPGTLIHVEGFDIPRHQTERLIVAREQYRQLAETLGRKIVFVRTNLREHSLFKQIDWSWTYSGALAGVAHLLGKSCSEYLISSSCEPRSYLFERFAEASKHWSSQRVIVAEVDRHFSRLAKVAAIMEYPIARHSLRVCWSQDGIEANCGVCEKCVRTRLCIQSAGWLDACKGLFVDQRPPECAMRDLIDKHGRVYGNSFFLSTVYSDLLETPGSLSAEVQEILTSEKREATDNITAYRPKPNWVVDGEKREGIIPDALFEPLLSASRGMRVYYHRVAGNIGDDLIHEGARQLFERHEIRLVMSIHEADQVVFCGGGNIGIWEHCELQRKPIYTIIERNSLSAVLHPQSVAPPGVRLPDFIRHRFVRESESQRILPGSILAPDLALAIAPIPQDAYGEPIFDEGVFVRRDMEGLFADFEESLGDPRTLVPRDLDEYFRLASHYRHIITDRLHFCVAGLLLGRKVTLLPNSYHKNLGMWKTWLKDLGCGWAEHPALVVSKMPSQAPRSSRTSISPSPTPASIPKSRDRIAMVLCIHNEEEFIDAHLRYHRKLGVEHAYVFLDRCSDRTEEIVRSFDWVEVFYRETPPPPYHFRYFQATCMNDAYQWASTAGYDWLLHIDPDEFVVAANDNLDAQTNKAEDITALWNHASLKTMLADIPHHILQIIFETREALPIRLDADFQENDVFLSPGTSYPIEIMDPATGEMRKPQKWLGHNLGKTMVRTNLPLEAFNGHFWTTEQGKIEGRSPIKLPIPTLVRGWHAHFHSLKPSNWWKKYKALARQNKLWPQGGRMEFPRAEWSDAALAMESESDVREFLLRCVVVKPELLEEMLARENTGVERIELIRELLADLAINSDRSEDTQGE